MIYENEIADEANRITEASLITRLSFIKCLFCEKKYKTENCGVVTELQANKAIIERKKLCFTCLKPSHVAKKYKSNISSFTCKNRYHAALCSNNKKGEKSNLTSVAIFQGSSSVLLQMSKVQVKTKTSGQIFPVRILFDSWSPVIPRHIPFEKKIKSCFNKTKRHFNSNAW